MALKSGKGRVLLQICAHSGIGEGKMVLLDFGIACARVFIKCGCNRQ